MPAAESPETNTAFQNVLVHVCMGRLWAKVYCRHEATNYKAWRMVVMSSILTLFATFKNFLGGPQEPQCIRCQCKDGKVILSKQ